MIAVFVMFLGGDLFNLMKCSGAAMKKMITATTISVAVLLTGCLGGGGGGSSTTTTPTPPPTVVSTLSFPLQSAFRAFFANGYGMARQFTVIGSCTESGSQSFTAATTSTTFEGVPAFSVTNSITYSASNCRTVPYSYSESIFLNSNYDEIGSSGTGFYGVFQTPASYPASVVVGSSGSYGTVQYYSDSTKTTSTGYAIYAYVIEPDTATTVIVNRIKKFYATTGSLVSTSQTRFRITSAGVITPISQDLVSGSTHLVMTYN